MADATAGQTVRPVALNGGEPEETYGTEPVNGE